MWGFAARNANYGMSDVMSNFASQCEHDTDLHFVGLDLLDGKRLVIDTGHRRVAVVDAP